MAKMGGSKSFVSFFSGDAVPVGLSICQFPTGRRPWFQLLTPILVQAAAPVLVEASSGMALSDSRTECPPARKEHEREQYKQNDVRRFHCVVDLVVKTRFDTRVQGFEVTKREFGQATCFSASSAEL